MDFYDSISKYYHHIFPLNKAQIGFVKNSHTEDTQKLSILDIGCAIGDLSLELSQSFKEVVGIDLDKGMIEKAKNIQHLSFELRNMLEIEQDFGNGRFDLIACFGNTLVHLESEEMVLDFLRKANEVLKENGKLLFQIINYDRIIDQNINHLPTIENDEIKFERNYTYHSDKKIVDFETILTVKENNQQISNNIPLLALRKDKVLELLEKAGFKKISFYGNFKRDELNSNSQPLIVEASR